ncbi:hypothetical protein KIH87_19175 [Paraneptunicella aestuarii]|uniref:hypothetical protein n=1 Tax=Paraneptunicella aestuarii TaxID=2831148 RepID=UPI001E47FE03|nr:hypothetical protein [Paraneptunicella aestuarii]UAA38754.1 hypothetical protein KIH87_19175 [Paraneptunicella aestuarii]
MQLVATPLDFSPKASQSHGWLYFVVISIFLHLGFVAVIQNQVKIGAVLTQDKPQEPKPIETYFVTSAMLAPPKSEPVPEVVETIPEEKSEKIEDNLQEVEEAELPAIQSSSLPSSSLSTEEEEIQANSEEAEPRSSSRAFSSTQSYFNSMADNKLSDIARQEAQQYQYNQAHPQVGGALGLDGSGYSSSGATVQYKAPKPIAVDCSSTVKQGLSILSTLTGGHIRCAGGGDIDSFIDKRMEKEDLLSPKKNNTR